MLAICEHQKLTEKETSKKV